MIIDTMPTDGAVMREYVEALQIPYYTNDAELKLDKPFGFMFVRHDVGDGGGEGLPDRLGWRSAVEE